MYYLNILTQYLSSIHNLDYLGFIYNYDEKLTNKTDTDNFQATRLVYYVYRVNETLRSNCKSHFRPQINHENYVILFKLHKKGTFFGVGVELIRTFEIKDRVTYNFEGSFIFIILPQNYVIIAIRFHMVSMHVNGFFCYSLFYCNFSTSP